MSAAQIQSLDILMSPVLELQTKINNELEVNPVLEQEDPALLDSDDLTYDSDGFDENFIPPADDNKNSLAETGKVEAEDLSDDQNYDIDSFEGMITRNWNNSYSVDEEKRSHFFNSLIDYQTIENELQSQLNFLSLSPKLFELCNSVVGSLDEQGFFKGSLADLAIISGVSVEDMIKALDIIKTLEPPGVGAKDVRESILLQLDRKGLRNQITEKLINECLEDIALTNYLSIARKLGESVEIVRELISEIKKLNPYPYAKLSNADESIFVIPELRIEKEDGKFVIVIEKEYQPKLKISEKYIEMLYSPDYSAEAKNYIKQKIQSANNIIKSIELRRETIKKISEIIIDSQYDFLERGNEFLKPLTMKQIADKISVHETTVSRAVSNKFIKTPQGVIPLKYFFSAGFQSSEGDMISNKGVMEKIRNIIDSEDKIHPLSDDDIAKKLNDKGIPVARRTVAKYREELGIISSRLRKEIS
ncbi:MAG: RNA polymerase sigma-54 factor [Lentisphaerae bacterium GWF2_38_69]|nr:MAG: RNA polymerase sigma-54 factor [Lentisphaerae bacterium GWF2_38_69]